MREYYEDGTLVEKTGGYKFPGVVLAGFRTQSGHERYVVESTLLPGLLHIFSPEQIRKTEDQHDE